MLKLITSYYFFLFSLDALAQISYLTSGNKIYFFDHKSCTLIDSAQVSNGQHFTAIALGGNGLLYGKKMDSIFVFDPDTKIASFSCKIPSPPNINFHYEALAADHSGNLIGFEYRWEIGRSVLYLTKYNPVTCQYVLEFKMPVTGVDPDIEFMNGNYYYGLQGNIYELDLQSDSIPIITKVIDNTANPRRTFNGLFATCLSDSTVFIATDYSSISKKTAVYKYDPVRNKNDTLCVLNELISDAAFYFSKPNYFYLGRDSAFCKGTVRKLRTNYTNTLWSTGQTGKSISVTAPGKYWATVSDSCGIFSDTIVLDSIVEKKLFIGNDTALCSAQRITLQSNYPNTTWVTGSDTLATNNSLQVDINSDTIFIGLKKKSCYPVEIMRDTIRILFGSTPPLVLITSKNKLCLGDSAIITSNFSNTIWSTGQIGSKITVKQGGTYIARIENACDTLVDSVKIQMYPLLPKLFIGRDTFFCTNSSVTLTANNAQTSWYSSSNSIIGNDSSINVVDSGYYYGRITDSCVTLLDTIYVALVSKIPLKITASSTVICSQPVTLTSNIPGSIWSTGVTGPQISTVMEGRIGLDIRMLVGPPVTLSAYRPYLLHNCISAEIHLCAQIQA